MKKYFTLISFSLLFFSSDIYSQWYRQYIDANITIEDVRFIDKYTGWLCGADLIYKTTNGGKNWINQPNQTNNLIRQIHPVDEEIVYACGYRVILKTSNGGKDWITLREGSGLVPQLNGLWFYNKNTGWFCGDLAVMRTTNGGNTFIDSMRIEGLLHDIYFKDSTTGNICGSINRTILRSINSGYNWYGVLLPINSTIVPYIYRQSFQGDLGWLASRNNVVYKTTDFGIYWDSISLIPRHPSFGHTFCIVFGNTQTGYAGGDSGKIHKSIDGGYTWEELNTSEFGIFGFLSMYAYNENIVWAVGGGGKILYTENGGGILVNIFENNLINKKELTLHQNFPNPFNPTTNIQFDLPEDNFVTIKVYDITGKEIYTLVSEFKQAGRYIVSFNGSSAKGGLASGIYYYRIKAENFEQVQKMMMIK